jgi:hypothetical protein
MVASKRAPPLRIQETERSSDSTAQALGAIQHVVKPRCVQPGLHTVAEFSSMRSRRRLRRRAQGSCLHALSPTRAGHRLLRAAYGRARAGPSRAGDRSGCTGLGQCL